jgi:Protein of unknown function (DUF3592)
MLRLVSFTFAFMLFSHPAMAQPIAGLSETQTVAVIGAVALVIFGAIGAYMIYAGLKNRRLARESEFWPSAGGTVLASEIAKRTIRSKQGTNTYYTPLVRYRYRVGGADHESTVIRFGDLESGSAKFAEEYVARYPTGATVSVRYDPKEMSRATLETQSAGATQIWTGIFFIVVPLIIVIVIGLIIISSQDMHNDLPPEVLEHLNTPN